MVKSRKHPKPQTFHSVESFDVLRKEKTMSKYQPLWDYVKAHDQDVYDLSFEDISRILGFEIDHAFLTYKKELLDMGYEVGKISLKNKRLTMHRISQS